VQANDASLANRPAYRPYRWATADFQLGLRPIKATQWMLLEEDYSATMREKRARMAEFPELYYGTLPCSLEAQHELRERVAAHLAADYPQHFRRSGRALQCVIDGAQYDLQDDSMEPLQQMSRFIEEDFMLLQEIDGAQIITAASNAYSSSGRLVASVGKNVAWAHEPVPQLTTKLGPRIDRMIGSIHADTPCERFNWQVTPLSTKFFPHEAHAANAEAMRQVCDALRRNPERAEELLWIRVERQTLSRLPESRAVAFTLHTYSDPLASLRGDVESLRAMLTLMRAYSDERLAYSEMNFVRDSVITWLEATVNSPA
jgi:dimethylamine monooxygenase subunit A